MVDLLAPFQAFFYGEISVAEFKTRIRVLLPGLSTVPPEILEYLDELHHEKRLSEQDYSEIATALKQVGAPKRKKIPEPIVSAPKLVVAPLSHPMEQAVDLDATIAISSADRKKLFASKSFMDYLDDKTAQSASGQSELTNGSTRIGETLSHRYQLNHLLHQNGYFLTFRAYDQQAKTQVLVNVLRSESIDHAALVALDREVKRIQRLQHDGIVPVRDIVRDQQTVFLVMDMVEGQTLGEMLREYAQGMSNKHSFQILRRIVDILHYAHARLVVHADLQPNNIFINDSGDVKIIDFGLVQTLFSYDHGLRRIGSSATDARIKAMPYASCEVLAGVTPAPNDDVFSLACITYLMFVGRHPYGQMNALEARRLSLEVEREHLSRMQWQGLSRGLSLQASERFNDVSEWVGMLAPTSGIARYKRQIIAGALSASVLMAGYWGYPVWQDAQTQTIMAQIRDHDLPLSELASHLTWVDTSHKAQIKTMLADFVTQQFLHEAVTTALASLQAVPDEVQRLVLQHAEIKPKLAAYYQAKIKQVADQQASRYDYPAAEKVMQEALQYYPNSRIFSHMQYTLLQEKAAVLKSLSRRLDVLLRQGKLLKTTEEDVFDVIARMQPIDPEVVQRNLRALVAAYVTHVTSASAREKAALLEAGLSWAPANAQLLALKRGLSSPVQQKNMPSSDTVVTPTVQPKPNAPMFKLLGKLRAAVAGNRVSEPSANNAIFYLKAMIQLNKSDPNIFLGRSEISGHYLQLSRDARAQGALGRAQKYLNLAGEVKTLGAEQ